MYIPSDSLVPQIGDYPEVQGISEQKLEEGLELLSEAGYPEGAGLPQIRIAVPRGEETRRIAELMKESWEAELELSAEIREYPFDSYYDELKTSDFTVGTLTWIGDFADPLTFLQMWTAESSLNLSRYENREYDETIEKALAEEQTDERLELLAEAERLLLKGAMVLPIKHSPAFNVVDLEEVEGWFPNPLDIHPFKYLHFSVPSLPQGVVEAPLPAATVELAQFP
jgi:peptide/nickel transport system substrate-binding protein/oligopeptide transport system substrate-binding protein